MFLREVKEDGAREREPDFIDVRDDPVSVFFIVVEGDFDEARGHIRRRGLVHRLPFAVTIATFANAAIRAAVDLEKFLVDELRETFSFASLAVAIYFRTARFAVESVRMNR